MIPSTAEKETDDEEEDNNQRQQDNEDDTIQIKQKKSSTKKGPDRQTSRIKKKHQWRRNAQFAECEVERNNVVKSKKQAELALTKEAKKSTHV